MKGTDESWQLKFWRLPHLAEVEMMHAQNITHDYPRHVHQEYSFAIMLRGMETHTCRGTSYNAFPGELMLLNADEAHSNRSVETEYRVIHIHPTALNQIATDVGGPGFDAPYFFDPVIKDPPLFRVLLNLHLKLEHQVSPLEQESEFISALGSLLRRKNKIRAGSRRIGKEPGHIRQVLDYLKSNYADNVSLSQLASIANLSPYYLLRVFRERTGVPPHEYQTQLRVIHAKKLFMNGRSISEAAVETGFFDQSHFSRNFKRIVGVTPGHYLAHSNIVQDTPTGA